MATTADPELWEITAYPDNSMDVDATSEADTQPSDYETRVRWKCAWCITTSGCMCTPRWALCGYISALSLLGTAVALFIVMSLVPLHGNDTKPKFYMANCTTIRAERRENATCELGTHRSRRTQRYPCVWITVKYDLDAEDWIETVLYDTDYDLLAHKQCSVNPTCSKYEANMHVRVSEFSTLYAIPDATFPCLVERDHPERIITRLHRSPRRPAVTMVIPGLLLILGLGLLPMAYCLGGDPVTVWRNLPPRRRIGSATYRVQL